MTHSHQKGKRAELDAVRVLRPWFPDVRRMIGAGRLDDEGDLEGIPGYTVQVADWADALRAVRAKPIECETQQANAGTPYGVSLIRLRGGLWRAVQTIEQWTQVAG